MKRIVLSGIVQHSRYALALEKRSAFFIKFLVFRILAFLCSGALRSLDVRSTLYGPLAGSCDISSEGFS